MWFTVTPVLKSSVCSEEVDNKHPPSPWGCLWLQLAAFLALLHFISSQSEGVLSYSAHFSENCTVSQYSVRVSKTWPLKITVEPRHCFTLCVFMCVSREEICLNESGMWVASLPDKLLLSDQYLWHRGDKMENFVAFISCRKVEWCERFQLQLLMFMASRCI